MSKKYKPISTLEYYNFRETNEMASVITKPYKVKVSDKDGNIITIEKDDALYACVSLAFDKDTGVLSLLDVAHDKATLAEIEMPNADYIYNCRYDETLNAILFDVKSLYGNNTNTIEINVDDLVELYEAGQGIEIGEKSEETGRKPISVKLVEGENLLKLSDNGLSISDEVATDEEVSAAISGKADIDYVDEKISGLTEEIDKIYDILGTDIDDPSLDERLDSKADLDEFNDLEEEVGEIETDLNELSGKVDSLEEKVGDLEGELSGLTPLSEKIYEISGNVETLSGDLQSLSAKVEDNEVFVYKVTDELPDNVREAYIVKNNLGEQLGERIDIYYDSSIVSIDYLPDEQVIRYVYIDSTGETHTVDIDLSKVVIEAEFGDGLQVNSGEVSVKIDSTSDSYLSVSENGIKLTGIFDFFTQLLNVNSQQWDAINNEISARTNVDNQLWAAIGAETASRQSVDGQLWEAINTLNTNLDTEREERRTADNALSGALSSEISRATEREDEIELNSVQADAALRSAIDTERSEREQADRDLTNALEDEIRDRNNADIELSDRISAVNNTITTLEENLSAETSARIQRDEELSNDIAEIQRTYVTKEYVDERDNQTLNDAISSAITSSTTYTDNAIDEVETNLKSYCDSGHTELQNAIDENTTNINLITNEEGNGTLDVLHKEFHDLINGIDENELYGLLNMLINKINRLEYEFDNLTLDLGIYNNRNNN